MDDDGSDMMVATCQVQGDGTGMWMIDSSFACDRKFNVFNFLLRSLIQSFASKYQMTCSQMFRGKLKQHDHI